MVLDGAFYASTAASLMMNGVCCVWQMQEEDDRRDAIRKDIRVEYERQRLQEREMWEHLHSVYSNTSGPRSEVSSSSEDERRRKLIAEKMILLNERSSNNERRDSTPASPSQVQSTRQHQLRIPVPKKSPPRGAIPVARRARSSPPPQPDISALIRKHASQHRQTASLNENMLSLFDEEDDTDEVESLVDVALK